VFSGHFIKYRQSEVGDETGNNYIAESVTDVIEIPSANLGFNTVDIWRARKKCRKVMATAIDNGK